MYEFKYDLPPPKISSQALLSALRLTVNVNCVHGAAAAHVHVQHLNLFKQVKPLKTQPVIKI